MTSINPRVRTHTLDPTPVAPRSYNLVAIQLLIKDTTGNAYVSLTVGRNSILNFPPKFEQECAELFYVVMTHHTVKANLEKGFSWPSEAIPYGVSLRVDF